MSLKSEVPLLAAEGSIPRIQDSSVRKGMGLGLHALQASLAADGLRCHG